MTAQRRQAECVRQRKYRASKKSQHERLQAELQSLMAQLKRLQSLDNHPSNRRRLDETLSRQIRHMPGLGTINTAAHHASKVLRAQIQRHAHLASLLYAWVAASQPPQPSLSPQPTWLCSTLLADPIARREGFLWLSDRVYHNAVRGWCPQPPTTLAGDTIDDTIGFQLHEDDNLDIAAMDLRIQSIVFEPLREIVSAFWTFLHEHSFATLWAVAATVVESIDEKVVYHEGVHPHHGTSMRRVMRLYDDESHRAVITYTKVATDERYPLADGDVRAHGSGWTIFERVTDSVTIVRTCLFNLTPVTTRGPIPLEEMGQLFLERETVSTAHKRYHRRALIERIRAAAETIHVDECQTWLRAFRAQAKMRSLQGAT
ncbi:Aste57867_2604 [Aphanomyces stellatus]|uniref:Aste57867_2604 protein n=1 Tax=Aphanomyces stellatus TaxID=120398 RepID=A0A485K7W5_9STRA|nr:hypothetical protein As57867_002597 [Aphanomyces stellatus]VFT79800.1 Aste57867_2604 [Aphanomyces stellatus]